MLVPNLRHVVAQWNRIRDSNETEVSYCEGIVCENESQKWRFQ